MNLRPDKSTLSLFMSLPRLCACFTSLELTGVVGLARSTDSKRLNVPIVLSTLYPCKDFSVYFSFSIQPFP